jgi:pyrroline-5-carboxylate reductase
MHHQSIGFIGGGRVTRIILEGWRRAQKLPAKVVVSDCRAEALARIKVRFPIVYQKIQP